MFVLLMMSHHWMKLQPCEILHLVKFFCCEIFFSCGKEIFHCEGDNLDALCAWVIKKQPMLLKFSDDKNKFQFILWLVHCQHWIFVCGGALFVYPSFLKSVMQMKKNCKVCIHHSRFQHTRCCCCRCPNHPHCCHHKLTMHASIHPLT